jgi:hypothetical protein
VVSLPALSIHIAHSLLIRIAGIKKNASILCLLCSLSSRLMTKSREGVLPGSVPYQEAVMSSLSAVVVQGHLGYSISRHNKPDRAFALGYHVDRLE